MPESMQMPSIDRTILDRPTTAAPPTPTEAVLVERARSDPQAFGTLYEIHYDRILNYVYRRTLNVALAEELTSNTFFKALRHLPRYRRRTPFQAWLYRIATNEIKMHWRTEKRRRTRQETFAIAELDRVCFPSTEADDRERIQQVALLNEALRRLPDRYQTVLALRYFEGLKHRQIADVLGKKTGTVKSLVSRGLARLRKIIDADATFPHGRHFPLEASGEKP